MLADKSLSFGKTGNNNVQLVLQHCCRRLNSDVARFATLVQTCSQPYLLQDRFHVGCKTPNMALQLIL